MAIMMPIWTQGIANRTVSTSCWISFTMFQDIIVPSATPMAVPINTMNEDSVRKLSCTILLR